MSVLPSATERVRAAARTLGLAIEVQTHAEGARTAEAAAAACGCDVGQIVKSLVFRGATSGGPLLLLVSGRNRVDEDLARLGIGEGVQRPNAAFVRDQTGFAIGGIPPFGHATPLPAFIDEDLLDYSQVWAAAGTPTTMFSIAPRDLQRAVGAKILRLKEGASK